MKKLLKVAGVLFLLAALAVVVIYSLTPWMDRWGATDKLPTPTPEVFIPLDKAIPDYGITLESVHLDIASAALDKSFPAGCKGSEPACTQAKEGYNFLSVIFAPRDLPEGQMLAYKNLPSVQVVTEGGESFPRSIYRYDNLTHKLTLGFEVPESATVFGLRWAEMAEIPLDLVAE